MIYSSINISFLFLERLIQRVVEQRAKRFFPDVVYILFTLFFTGHHISKKRRLILKQHVYWHTGLYIQDKAVIEPSRSYNVARAHEAANYSFSSEATLKCCSQVSLHFMPHIPEHNVIACHDIFESISQSATFYLMPLHTVPFLPSRPKSQTTCQQQVIKCNGPCSLHLITLGRGEFQNMSTQVEG